MDDVASLFPEYGMGSNTANCTTAYHHYHHSAVTCWESQGRPDNAYNMVQPYTSVVCQYFVGNSEQVALATLPILRLLHFGRCGLWLAKAFKWYGAVSFNCLSDQGLQEWRLLVLVGLVSDGFTL